jgi:hypothetical protein
MAGFFTFIYFLIAIMISFKMGFNWLSGSLMIGSVCALFGGSGAKGMWQANRKLPGVIMGVAVVWLGVITVQSSGVYLNFWSISITADLWVIVGSIIFFIVTNEASNNYPLENTSDKL